MIFGALLEALGVGIIYPFISMLNDPNSIADNEIFSKGMQYLNLNSTNFILLYSIGFLLFFIIKNVLIYGLINN